LRIELVRARIQLSGEFRPEQLDQVKAEIELCESSPAHATGTQIAFAIDGEWLTRIPEPGASELRIKVKAYGVCHGDVFTKEGSWPGIGILAFAKRSS
jgi:hypothetical protein